ncbi:hypothetical protein ACHAQA_004483 [Verticillium albo-atrum]
MVLKRKRSSSELSSSPSYFSSSPMRPDTMDMDTTPISPPFAAYSSHFAPSHLPSRTMKRFRDNRPSQEEVHQRTLNMLYSAQQQSDAVFAPTSPSPMPRIHEQPSQPAPTAQRSLHSFWNIGSAPAASAPPPSMNQSYLEPSSCEDCGVGLGALDGADSMDINGYGFDADSDADHTCGACRKRVCSHCSVTNLGEQRRCLHCAGRKMPLDAIGLGLGATQFAAEIAVTIVKLKRLWDEVQDVPDHIQFILSELEEVEFVLEDLEAQIKCDEVPAELQAQVLPRVLRSTQRASEALQKNLQTLNDQLTQSKGLRRKFVSMRVVIKKPMLEKMEGQLRTALNLLNLAVNTYTMQVPRAVCRV